MGKLSPNCAAVYEELRIYDVISLRQSEFFVNSA
jgi:hypothetical protein